MYKTTILQPLVYISAEGHDLTIDLSAQKEKLMHEKLKLTSSKCKSRYVILHLHARVLGKTIHIYQSVQIKSDQWILAVYI